MSPDSIFQVSCTVAILRTEVAQWLPMESKDSSGSNVTVQAVQVGNVLLVSQEAHGEIMKARALASDSIGELLDGMLGPMKEGT